MRKYWIYKRKKIKTSLQQRGKNNARVLHAGSEKHRQ